MPSPCLARPGHPSARRYRRRGTPVPLFAHRIPLRQVAVRASAARAMRAAQPDAPLARASACSSPRRARRRVCSTPRRPIVTKPILIPATRPGSSSPTSATSTSRSRGSDVRFQLRPAPGVPAQPQPGPPLRHSGLPSTSSAGARARNVACSSTRPVSAALRAFQLQLTGVRPRVAAAEGRRWCGPRPRHKGVIAAAWRHLLSVRRRRSPRQRSRILESARGTAISERVPSDPIALAPIDNHRRDMAARRQRRTRTAPVTRTRLVVFPTDGHGLPARRTVAQEHFLADPAARRPPGAETKGIVAAWASLARRGRLNTPPCSPRRGARHLPHDLPPQLGFLR